MSPLKIINATFLLVIGITSFAAAQSRPAPGVPRLNETMYPTEDHVITTHDVRDYGAVADDSKDDTDAFQKAIDDCNASGGGVIFVPAGRYIFRSELELKSGVILRGEWRNPRLDPKSPIGTLFCVYYGRGLKPEDPPFIHMFPSSGLKDIAIWYPEQSFEDPVPYSSTIKQAFGNAASLENITLYNPWRGVILGPEMNQLMTVKNLFMSPLHIGFIRDEAYDNPRLQMVFIQPKYWIESGLPGSPAAPSQQSVFREFLLQESIGAMITHFDWVWMYGWVIEGCHIGVQTRRSLRNKRGNRDGGNGPNGGWVKLRLKDNFIGMEVGKNNHQGWFNAEVYITSNVRDSIGIQTTDEFGSIAQFTNVTFDGDFKHCIQTLGKQGRVTLSGCTFKRWSPSGYAIYGEAGTIQLTQNHFVPPSNHIFLGDGINTAVILGNTFAGSPDISNSAPSGSDVIIDHSPLNLEPCDISGFVFPEAIYKPESSKFYNVRDFGAKGDGNSDDTAAFQKALDQAKASDVGTVYVPVGDYALKTGIIIPEKVELRGVFDMMHHTIDKFKSPGIRGTRLFAYNGKGDENGTPFIQLKSGASLRGVTIYHPEQLWQDYLKTGEFTKYPWAIRSLGPNARLKDVTMVNAYLGADFGTYDNTGFRIDYLCGTPLKIGLYIDNCFGEGFVKNTHWNPSFWAWSSYNPETTTSSSEIRDALLNTLTSFKFGYTERLHSLHMFSFGSNEGNRFINNPKHGGANGFFIGNGVDLSETSIRFEDIGQDAIFVNTQIVSMEAEGRKRYIDILDNVQGKAKFYNLLMWGYVPTVDVGIEMRSGDFFFNQLYFRTFGMDCGIKQTGGSLLAVSPAFHLEPKAYLGQHHDQRLHSAEHYGIFEAGINKSEIIGTIIQEGSSADEVFINNAGNKTKIKHSVNHMGKAGYF